MVAKALAFGFMFLVATFRAQGAEPQPVNDVEKVFCAGGGPEASINSIKAQLDRADKVFPNVPPEEAKY